MNCTGARKFLYAFADGQLGVKDNCEVLDHLKMCPDCSRVIDEHQALRATLGRSIRDTSAPAALRDKVCAAVGSYRRAPAASSAGWRLTRFRAYAVAAGFVLVASVFLWKSIAVRQGESAEPASNVIEGEQIAVQVERGPSAATMIAQVHNVCCSHGAAHHRRGLPNSLHELGATICAHYNNKITALAPDLVAYGYRFESANYCGVRNKPDSDGGHIIYLSDKDARRLSFFSVPRWDCIDKCRLHAVPGANGCRKYEVDQDGGGKLSILAWHNDATTYICCGQESFDVIEPMAKEVRAVLSQFDHELKLAMGR